MYRIRLTPRHDHHSHVSLYASLLGAKDLSAFESPEEAFGFLATLPKDRLSLVKGWKSERLALAPEELKDLPPVLIINFSLHGYRLSPAALPFVKELWPEFHDSYADSSWAESHVAELFSFYGKLAVLTEASLDAFMTELGALGTGSAEDLSLTDGKALALIQASRWKGRVKFWASPTCYRGLDQAGKAQVEGFKLFLDGAIGSRSAALPEAFLSGERGELLYSDQALSLLLRELQPEGKALTIHAIGSLAIEQALVQLEILAAEERHFTRLRLEHVQFISHTQAMRCKRLGIVLSMQPNFNSDSLDYTDRLPRSVLAANNPFRMLIDGCGFVPGEDLVFGSDGMPHGLEYALQWSLFPVHPIQQLSVQELEAGYGQALGEASGAPGLEYEVDYDSRTVRRL